MQETLPIDGLGANPCLGAATWIGFDTETTGLNTDTDRIVQVALIVKEAGAPTSELRKHTWLINPGVPMPEAAAAVHGFTTEFLREHGQDPALALDQAANLIATKLRAGGALVAFNAGFDIPILAAELARHGLPSIAERIGQPLRAVVDPLVLDRHIDRYRRGKRNLESIARHYAVAIPANLHDAGADVTVTLYVLDAMIRAYPELGQYQLADLHDLQVRAHRTWAEDFNRYLESRGRLGDVNPNWLG